MCSLAVLITLSVNAASAPVVEAKTEVVTTIAVETIPEKINRYANKHNVSAEIMTKIMRCENVRLDPTKQSDLRYTFSSERRGIVEGERERSFGLVQIHLPDHNITYEQATDPDFAIEFLAKSYAQGKASWMWKTCYTKAVS